MTAKNKQRQRQQQIPFGNGRQEKQVQQQQQIPPLRCGMTSKKAAGCCPAAFVFMLWFYFREMGIVNMSFLFGLECWG